MTGQTIPRVEFHFDFGSSNAYLAHLVIPDIEARTGVRFDYVPVLLGAVFQATGNAAPAESLNGVRNKREYAALETRRFVARHGLESRFRRNPDAPVDTLRIMRGAVAARRRDADLFSTYVRAVFDAMWRYPRKMDEPEVITETLRAAGLPVGDLVASMRDPEVKAELKHLADRAVLRGVFGSPSFFVEDALFFGKDRLRDVEEEIVARSHARVAARAC